MRRREEEAGVQSPGLEAAGAAVWEAILEAGPEAARERTDTARAGGVAVGRLLAIAGSGVPLVEVPGAGPRPARSLAALTPRDVGREAALAFEGGDPAKPILLGLIQTPAPDRAPPPQVTVDGERLVLTAGKEIVLGCGEASITLTRAGKVLIRGAYLLSRSLGVNRIQGGSVQIN